MVSDRVCSQNKTKNKQNKRSKRSRHTDNDRREQPGEPSQEIDVHIWAYVAERREQTERGVGDFVQIIQSFDGGHSDRWR